MPYRLVPPKPGRSPFWRVRGTEFGIYCDRSAQTRDRREAQQILAALRDDAKRLALSGPAAEALTFAAAAISYMQSGRDPRFLAPLITHFRDTALDSIGQAAVDEAAATLYPDRAAATLNRQVYTPVSALMKHAGVETRIRRPKGWRSRPRPHFLREDAAFALLEGAKAVDRRLAALLTFLLYCGPRLSEALRLMWSDVDFANRSATIGRTKNGDPVTVNLPPVAIAALATLDRTARRVFGLTKCGRLYALLAEAEAKAGIELPPRSAFHILRHTHAMLRRRHTGADTSALVATGLWKSHEAARVYEHVDATEEARKNDLLPTPTRVKLGRRSK